MSTCTVSFSAVDPGLSVLPAAKLVFSPRPAVVRGAGSQVMAPNDKAVTADGAGAGVIALAPGGYILTITTSAGSKQAEITVPDAATALLGDLIDAPIGAWEMSELQTIRTDVNAALDQVNTITATTTTALTALAGQVQADRQLTQTASAAGVAAAPVATSAAAQALVYRDQAALYAGSFGPGMILHQPDETYPAGFWDTGLRQTVTDIRGGTSTLALISNWSVASLYTGGIATAWFDFSTFGRVFQDLLGAAVTAAGQSVGMVRDAITAALFGPNLVTNGDFAAATGWTLGLWTVSGGAANKSVGPASDIIQNLALTAGRTYRVAGTVAASAGSVMPRFLGAATTNGVSITASGAFEQYLTAVAGNTQIGFLADAAFAGSIDNISVQEVLGIVATQPNLGQRGRWASWPVTGRRNLLIPTDNLADPGVFKSEVTTDVGLSSADGRTKVIPNTVSYPPVWRFIGHPIGTTINGQTVTYSVDIWPNGLTWAWVGLFDRANVYSLAAINLATGAASAVSTLNAAVTSATVTTAPLPGGGWRVTFSANVGTALDSSAWVGVSPHNSGSSPTTWMIGDGVAGIDIARPQLERGGVATAYQTVSGSNGDLITEPGIRNSGAWRPDLSDDALQFVLPTVGDGFLTLIGVKGAYTEFRPGSLGATITIGGTTAGTLGTPGILRYTDALKSVLFRPLDWTPDERLRLGRRYRPEGGGGWPMLGPNLLANSGFDSAANWTTNTGWGIGGGFATHAPGAQSELVQAVTVTPGLSYLVNYDVLAVRAAGAISVAVAALNYVTFESVPTVGTGKRGVWVPQSSGEFRFRVAAAGDIDIDNVTLRLLTPEW